MPIKPVASAADQPKSFEFLDKNTIEEILSMYPKERKQSAVMPLLDLAQRQEKGNWISLAAISCIAKLLDMKLCNVYEVASFYSMYNLKPVGKYFIQICTTTPCWLCNSDDIVSACEEELNIKMNETTSDGMFSLVAVECLGACANAPVIQINDDYYEDLNKKLVVDILRKLKNGEKVKTGSQTGRKSSEPVKAY